MTRPTKQASAEARIAEILNELPGDRERHRALKGARAIMGLENYGETRKKAGRPRRDAGPAVDLTALRDAMHKADLAGLDAMIAFYEGLAKDGPASIDAAANLDTLRAFRRTFAGADG